MSKEEKNIPVSEAQADAEEEMKEAEAIEETENAELAAAIKASEEAKAAAEEYKRKWYSVTAEYDNYRKRTASTRATAYAEGRADVVGSSSPSRIIWSARSCPAGTRRRTRASRWCCKPSKRS